MIPAKQRVENEPSKVAADEGRSLVRLRALQSYRAFMETMRIGPDHSHPLRLKNA